MANRILSSAATVCDNTALYWTSSFQSEQIRLVISTVPETITVVMTRGYPLYCEKGISVPVGLNDKEVLEGQLLKDAERLGQTLSLFYTENHENMMEENEGVDTYGPLGPIFNTAALSPALVEKLDMLWAGNASNYLTSCCVRAGKYRPRIWKDKVNGRIAISMNYHLHPRTLMIGRSGKFALSFERWNPIFAREPSNWVSCVVTDTAMIDLYGLDKRIAEWAITNPNASEPGIKHSIITLPMSIHDLIEDTIAE